MKWSPIRVIGGCWLLPKSVACKSILVLTPFEHFIGLVLFRIKNNGSQTHERLLVIFDSCFWEHHLNYYLQIWESYKSHNQNYVHRLKNFYACYTKVTSFLMFVLSLVLVVERLQLTFQTNKTYTCLNIKMFSFSFFFFHLSFLSK